MQHILSIVISSNTDCFALRTRIRGLWCVWACKFVFDAYYRMWLLMPKQLCRPFEISSGQVHRIRLTVCIYSCIWHDHIWHSLSRYDGSIRWCIWWCDDVNDLWMNNSVFLNVAFVFYMHGILKTITIIRTILFPQSLNLIYMNIVLPDLIYKYAQPSTTYHLSHSKTMKCRDRKKSFHIQIIKWERCIFDLIWIWILIIWILLNLSAYSKWDHSRKQCEELFWLNTIRSILDLIFFFVFLAHFICIIKLLIPFSWTIWMKWFTRFMNSCHFNMNELQFWYDWAMATIRG